MSANASRMIHIGCSGNLAYVRFHGGVGKYYGRYRDEVLLDWSDWLKRQVENGKSIRAYFNIHDA